MREWIAAAALLAAGCSSPVHWNERPAPDAAVVDASAPDAAADTEPQPWDTSSTYDAQPLDTRPPEPPTPVDSGATGDAGAACVPSTLTGPSSPTGGCGLYGASLGGCERACGPSSLYVCQGAAPTNAGRCVAVFANDAGAWEYCCEQTRCQPWPIDDSICPAGRHWWYCGSTYGVPSIAPPPAGCSPIAGASGSFCCP